MNLLLLEPVGSQIIGVFMGIDEIPGTLTLVGMIEIVIAINLMYKGSLALEADLTKVQGLETELTSP